MSTVTFSNGKSATFQGTPTPQDIDYVANQMGIQPDGQGQKENAAAPVLSGLNGFLGSVSDARNAGIAQAKQGFQESMNATNPGQVLEGVGGQLAGAVNAVTSPLAPFLSPIGKGIDYAADKISSIPAVQNFASSPAGQATAEGAQDVNNLATVAGAVAGAKGVAESAASNPRVVGPTSGIPTAESPITSLQTGRIRSGIADATPSYSPKMIGEQATVKAPDGTTVPRINEGGIVKGRTVNPSQAEIEAGTQLARTSSYNPGGTALEKMNAGYGEISNVAEGLDRSLKSENVLRAPQQVMKVVRDAVNEASQNSLLLQRTDPIVVNYLRVAQRAIDQSDGTLDGEWNVRKILDQAYEDAGGKYGNNKGLDQIHRASRNALLDDMESYSNNTGVKSAMGEMKNLYNAVDVLQDKAKAEGGSAWERFSKRHKTVMKLLPKIAEGAGLGSVMHLVD
jgi:hypothetical protein